ncbi:alkaline phosphatase family protein [Helicobacter felis]|uniref:hypothetical protein n=1 Tax=Helicobacter felis TaxID=214 RepID=UPI001F48475A|nr:hypothetical protein [Helicobacter felis]
MVLDMRFFLMWLAPVFVVLFSANAESQYGRFVVGKVAFYSFFISFLIYWGLSFIKQRFVLQTTKNILLTVVLFFAFIDFFASYYFNMILTESLVNMIFSSHWVEVRAFFTLQVIPHTLLVLTTTAVCVAIASIRFQLVIQPKRIKEIFNLFKDKNAIILYLSDHGQDMFRSGHVFVHKCSNYGVEVPFAVYVTDKFKQSYPQKVKAIAQAVNKPFMIDV